MKGIISTRNHRRWAPAREGRPSEFIFPRGSNNANLMYLFGFMDGLKLPPIAIDEGRLKAEYFIRLVIVLVLVLNQYNFSINLVFPNRLLRDIWFPILEQRPDFHLIHFVLDGATSHSARYFSFSSRHFQKSFSIIDPFNITKKIRCTFRVISVMEIPGAVTKY